MYHKTRKVKWLVDNRKNITVIPIQRNKEIWPADFWHTIVNTMLYSEVLREIVLIEYTDGTYGLVDGQQRLHTILQFVDSITKLCVSKIKEDLIPWSSVTRNKEILFSDLSSEIQKKFLDTSVNTVVFEDNNGEGIKAAQCYLACNSCQSSFNSAELLYSRARPQIEDIIMPFYANSYLLDCDIVSASSIKRKAIDIVIGRLLCQEMTNDLMTNQEVVTEIPELNVGKSNYYENRLTKALNFAEVVAPAEFVRKSRMFSRPGVFDAMIFTLNALRHNNWKGNVEDATRGIMRLSDGYDMVINNTNAYKSRLTSTYITPEERGNIRTVICNRISGSITPPNYKKPYVKLISNFIHTESKDSYSCFEDFSNYQLSVQPKKKRV